VLHAFYNISFGLSNKVKSIIAQCKLRSKGLTYFLHVKSTAGLQSVILDLFWTQQNAQSKFWTEQFTENKRNIDLTFYQNVTTLRSGTAFAFVFRLSVCRLSVCVTSVTFLHHTLPTEIFGNVSMPFCTIATRWPPRKILRRSSQGNPSVGGWTQEGWPDIATLDMSKVLEALQHMELTQR